MVLFLVRALMLFLAALVGLVAAAAIVPNLTINFPAVLFAAAIFAVAQAILFPFFVSTVRRKAAALVGAVGLVTAFAALVITAVVSDGVVINGTLTWLYGSLVVWLTTMVATLFLPMLLVKMGLSRARDLRNNPAS